MSNYNCVNTDYIKFDLSEAMTLLRIGIANYSKLSRDELITIIGTINQKLEVLHKNIETQEKSAEAVTDNE